MQPPVRVVFLTFLERKYGKMVIQLRCFTCVGIRHRQDDDYTVTMDQDEYAAQMRPIDTASVNHQSDDYLVPMFMVMLYMSLLGGIAWMVLTRVDICVFVNRLQRNAKAPRLVDVKDLNKLLRWVKRQTSSTVYRKLVGPVGLAVLTDAAFRADETDCLALRAAIAIIVEIRGDRPGGNFHLLDFYSRKQSRVNRSTFSAELNAMLEAIDLGLVLSCFVTEVLHGTSSAMEVSKTIRDGTLKTPVHIIGDAHAVFEAVTATEISVPNEKSMLFAVRAVNDYLKNGLIRVHRVDTRDMLADALTKGSVSRSEILKALQTGVWTLRHLDQHHVSVNSGREPRQ